MSDDFDDYDFSEFTEQDFAAIDAALVRAHGGPAVQIAIVEDSPFKKFRSRRKNLAVTDLVSPLWCEVQYEYSLYGERHKPPHLRPPAFASKNGTQIRVQQQVADANDRRLERGKSVHKALEDELHPDKLIVNVASEEERFGLRLLTLMDGFNELVSNGITRELPVFAITHAQVVIGIIDEVLWSPLTKDQATSPGSPALDSPPKKKQRLLSQQTAPAAQELPDTVGGAEPTKPENLYELHIVDYKTRRSSTIPLDEDSLSPRLQLMMYHRMLSSLLEPEAFDFDLLWRRLELDPTKPFSTQFLKQVHWEQRQIDPTDCNVHLDRLVSEWVSTVQRRRAGFMGVSQQLQLVYRRELDLARAIEDSLSEMGHQEAAQVARHVAQNVKQVGPSSVGCTSAVWKDLISPSEPEQTNPALAWGIQQSLLTHARKALANSQQASATYDETEPVVDAQVQGGTISPIIGTKEFRMNDDELDPHIADILQWWLGARPPRGVDVSQTNRCFSCEYQSSCEWREQKAKEAVRLASNRLSRVQACTTEYSMIMDGWVDYLHVDLLGEHILFRSLRLQSLGSFIPASIVITTVSEYGAVLAVCDCSLEKLSVWICHLSTITIYAHSDVKPARVRASNVVRNSTMTVPPRAIAIVVIMLSLGQFTIEYAEYQEPNLETQYVLATTWRFDRKVTVHRVELEEPLLGTSFGRRRPTGRFRARSKPDNIFIHPNESNLARADAVALELGIAGDTELVQGNKTDGKSWQLGKGRDVAREAFASSHRRLIESDIMVFDAGDGDRL
ncbi:exonuclease V a 5' deoxyribonuclease-domain-containing protein [Boletus reticuloceps]|uniref:Exonuclease V a 5' deoxyribonuclease-domain-containing protein n=1 Tax=Boletus reticuloceps TaxID=495285 RepID=A0A8I2YYV0_9AGAM|nr:exonuclease V a 5' deoxyribonuclease-domain-containing protein [Boletus reticuloceps]